jgi:hypothetical protein
MRNITITIPDDAGAHPCLSLVTPVVAHPPGCFFCEFGCETVEVDLTYAKSIVYVVAAHENA